MSIFNMPVIMRNNSFPFSQKSSKIFMSISDYCSLSIIGLQLTSLKSSNSQGLSCLFYEQHFIDSLHIRDYQPGKIDTGAYLSAKIIPAVPSDLEFAALMWYCRD